MKTILEYYDCHNLTQVHSELRTLALEEAVKLLNARDLLGAGEWYLSALKYSPPQEHDALISKTIGSWASSAESFAPPDTLQDLQSRLHEFAGSDLALALIVCAARLKALGFAFPKSGNDLLFKLAEPTFRLFSLPPKLRPGELAASAVAHYESNINALCASAELFQNAGCLGAKVPAADLVKHARTFKTFALPGERPFMGDLELLLGGPFRGFCASCENRNASAVAEAAPTLREHVNHVFAHARRRQNSVLWRLIVEPVGKHVLNLIDEESRVSEQMTIPCLGLTSDTFKADLSKAAKEMTFSCRLGNSGSGIAKDVAVRAIASSSGAELRLLEPNPGFEIGPKSTQVLTFALTLREPVEQLRVSLCWNAATVRGKRYESEAKTLTLLQQRTQPDWTSLRLDPPYGTKAISRKERLFGRTADMRRLTVCAAGGTSCFVWGAKRVGKTSVMQVLADELRHNAAFVPVYLRVGEIAGYQEGKIAHTIAQRLTARLSAAVPVPSESDFGASLAPLVPFAEQLVERFPDKKFIVIVDEFDDLDTAFYTGQRGKLFVTALRSLSEVGLTFFFVGSERMSAIHGKHAMVLNKWDNLFLDVITSREDCKALVLNPVERAIEYQPECVDDIVDYCGGNPFYMHLLCSEVFNLCAVEERTFIGESDLHAIKQARCRTLGETNFAHFWEDNPQLDDQLKQQQAAENCLILCCLARSEGKCDSLEHIYEIQDGLGLAPAERLSSQEIKAVLARLANRKVLRADGWGGGHQVILPIFRDWLVQNAELCLLPRWRRFCATRAEVQPPAETAVQISEPPIPISEDDLLLVSQNLVYCGKQKDAVEIRIWLRQFDDDVRIQVAFRLLKRLAEKGFVSEGSRRHLLTVMEQAIHAARNSMGGAPWKIVLGRIDNLCVSYVDSESDLKSGATLARELAKSLRPGKTGPAASIYDWMKTHKEQDPLVVLVDDFAGSGTTLSGGLKKFLQHPDHQGILKWYLEQQRLLCCVLSAFPDAQNRIRENFPDLPFLTSQVFGEDVRALDPEAGIFDNPQEIQFARDMLMQIGQELTPQNPLGHKALAALVCFHNTVPNNTLPIFWSNGKVNEKPWKPLFPRA